MYAYAAHSFFPIAADFLLHSLNDNPVDPYVHGGASSVACAIKDSPSYKSVVMGYLKSLDGHVDMDDYVQIPGGLRFGGLKDLHLAINKARIYVKGEVCNGRILKTLRQIDVKIEDDYDYHSIVEQAALENVFGALTVFNNRAHYHQVNGVIVQYLNRVLFRDYRIGRNPEWK